MAWKEVVTIVSFRKEVLGLAKREDANVQELALRFKVSRKTIYKWLKRHNEEGEEGLKDHSRRPQNSPTRCDVAVENAVLKIRDRHPAWGARKIVARLRAVGEARVPAVSTIHEILRRYGRIDAAESTKHTAWHRFEHPAPNQLWQMDFKGWFGLDAGVQCHPLTILDDHSRYAVCLQACTNQKTGTVQLHLTTTFRRYGLPERMTMDNGSPWGGDEEHPYTPLTVWLMRLGVGFSHSRPYHPQTQGKDERFHRTLKAELLIGMSFRDVGQVQRRFDNWLTIYNQQRPHQAIGMAVPATRYQVSWRAFPEMLPPIEYSAQDDVRRVQDKGLVSYKGKEISVGKAFRGYPVAFRPTTQDGIFTVHFCRHQIAQIDLREYD